MQQNLSKEAALAGGLCAQCLDTNHLLIASVEGALDDGETPSEQDSTSASS